jgi:hypothetical protein
VVNTRNGDYLERARVTVAAAGLEAFTDSAGYYRLVNVPAGVVRMKIFYTGLDAQTDSVAVAAGATVQRGFSLTASTSSSSPRRRKWTAPPSRSTNSASPRTS